MKPTIPENFTVVTALNPATDAAGRTSNYFSLKHAKKATFIVDVTQGNAATVAITLNQATTVAGGSAKAITAVQRLWVTEDVSTTVVPTQATSAASYTTGAALATKKVIIEIDPTTLDVAGGFDCVAITTGASNVANLTAATLVLDNKFSQAAPLSPRVN